MTSGWKTRYTDEEDEIITTAINHAKENDLDMTVVLSELVERLSQRIDRTSGGIMYRYRTLTAKDKEQQHEQVEMNITGADLYSRVKLLLRDRYRMEEENAQLRQKLEDLKPLQHERDRLQKQLNDINKLFD